MKSLVLAFCLAQLWGCHAAPPNLGPGYRALDCDDPESEQAALVAMDYLNKNLFRGYKHTLNQIDKVKVWPRVSEPPAYELKDLFVELNWVSQKITSPSKNENAEG